MNNHDRSVIMVSRGQNKVSSLSASKPSKEDFMNITRNCSVEGCPRPHHGKGYCSAHYVRLMRYEDPNGGTPIPKYIKKICAAKCDREVFVGGYCQTHWVHKTGRHEASLKHQREYRSSITYDKSPTFKYEKTVNGFLMRVYRNMYSRVTGIQKERQHLYLGKSLLPKEEFYVWANADDSFNELFKVWESSNYDRKLTPSINRIDNTKGYELGNMEWITHSENSSIASKGQEYSWDRWNNKWVKRKTNQ